MTSLFIEHTLFHTDRKKCAAKCRLTGEVTFVAHLELFPHSQQNVALFIGISKISEDFEDVSMWNKVSC